MPWIVDPLSFKPIEVAQNDVPENVFSFSTRAEAVGMAQHEIIRKTAYYRRQIRQLERTAEELNRES